MEIQYYDINFVTDMRKNIVNGISEDIKKSLLHIKRKNGFNVYSNQTTPSFGNKIETPNICHGNVNPTTIPTTIHTTTTTTTTTDTSGEGNAWRTGTLQIRKQINPKANLKKNELFLLLNKLSESNLQIITKQIISLVKECEKEGDSVFATLIERLFRSAMIQVSFCPIYAKICVNLISELDSQKVMTELDDRITRQLNSLNDYSSKMELSDYDSFCDDVAFKNRYIGCYQFITELFNNKCLPFKRIINILKDLDTNIEGQENSIKIDTLIESICKIYQSIDRHMLSEFEVNEVIQIIKNIYKKYITKMSSRAKFIFEDVLENKH